MRPESMRGQPVNSGVPGPNKTPFCVHDDEWLWASDEFLRETGQTHHVVDTEAAPTQDSWVGGESTKVLNQWLCSLYAHSSAAECSFWNRTENRLLWPPYGIGQAIIFYPVVSSSFFFFLSSFPLAYSQPSNTGCLPYFHTWCGLGANLECRSEMCCTRLTENTERKNYTKNRHLRTIAQLCRAISSQLRHVLTIGKKFKQQYIPQSPQYAELRLTNGSDLLDSLGHPS